MSFLLRGATATGGRNSTAVIREAPAAGTAAIGALGAAINVLDAPPTAVLGAVFGHMPLYTTGAAPRAAHPSPARHLPALDYSFRCSSRWAAGPP